MESPHLCELKNKMIHNLQDIFYEYNRMHEVVLQTTSEVDLEKRQMINTIRSLKDTEDIRLNAMESLESEILSLQKTNHEYSELIKKLEDRNILFLHQTFSQHLK